MKKSGPQLKRMPMGFIKDTAFSAGVTVKGQIESAKVLDG